MEMFTAIYGVSEVSGINTHDLISNCEIIPKWEWWHIVF